MPECDKSPSGLHEVRKWGAGVCRHCGAALEPCEPLPLDDEDRACDLRKDGEA